MVEDRFNLSRVALGASSGGCTTHALGKGGVWHAHNMTAVSEYLRVQSHAAKVVVADRPRLPGGDAES
eukprot:6852043-Prymnesium_polylepis.1